MGPLSAVATICLAIAALSCSDGTQSSSLVAPGLDASNSNANNGGGPGHLVPCEHRPALQAGAVIGPAGGQLSIGPNKLVVPAGALDRPTSITGTVFVDSVAHVQFEPEGLHFEIPAQLTVSVAGCQIPHNALTDIVYLRDGAIIEQIPSMLDRQGQKITGPINHFSDYSIAFDFSGYSVAFNRRPW